MRVPAIAQLLLPRQMMALLRSLLGTLGLAAGLAEVEEDRETHTRQQPRLHALQQGEEDRGGHRCEISTRDPIALNQQDDAHIP